MILDEDMLPGHPHAFPKEFRGLMGVVQHVYENNRVKMFVWKRDGVSIVQGEGNGAARSGVDVDSRDPDARLPFSDQRRDLSVPASDIKGEGLGAQ
jgi:hypothetical protein